MLYSVHTSLLRSADVCPPAIKICTYVGYFIFALARRPMSAYRDYSFILLYYIPIYISVIIIIPTLSITINNDNNIKYDVREREGTRRKIGKKQYLFVVIVPGWCSAGLQLSSGTDIIDMYRV